MRVVRLVGRVDLFLQDEVQEFHVVVVEERFELGQVTHSPGGAPYQGVLETGETSLSSFLCQSPSSSNFLGQSTTTVTNGNKCRVVPLC